MIGYIQTVLIVFLVIYIIAAVIWGINMAIGFWKTKREGFSTSHQRGLDEQQIKMLQSLHPGDRLGLWVNSDKTGENRPGFTLKVMVE